MKLSEPFEFKGYWWKPDAPDNVFRKLSKVDTRDFYNNTGLLYIEAANAEEDLG